MILKPDTIQRSLIGEIVNRLERTGLKLVGLKMIQADEKRLTDHYGKADDWYLEKGTKRVRLMQEAGKAVDPNRPPIEYGKDIIRGVIRYMKASPLVAMVWEGNQAALVIKKITGDTEPATSDVGTIRGDLTTDSYQISAVDDRAVRNLIHCSESAEEGKREIALWFSEAELTEYRLVGEQILYDVNLDGILE